MLQLMQSRESKIVLSPSQDECIPAALECFMTELNGEVLSNECDDSEYVVGLGVDFLTRVKSHLLKAKSHVSIPLYCVAKIKNQL